LGHATPLTEVGQPKRLIEDDSCTLTRRKKNRNEKEEKNDNEMIYVCM